MKPTKTVNKSTFKQEQQVYKLIAKNHNTSVIMKKTGCSRKTVDRIMKLYIAVNAPSGIRESVKIGLGHRTEPYQTEQQMQALPTYTCTNAQMLTPMRSDWKLYNFVDE